MHYTAGSFICPITGEWHVLGEPQRKLLSVDRTFTSQCSDYSTGGWLLWEKGDEKGIIRVNPFQRWTVEFAISARIQIHKDLLETYSLS